MVTFGAYLAKCAFWATCATFGFQQVSSKLMIFKREGIVDKFIQLIVKDYMKQELS